MRICDLLHETCFKLWNLYKERNKKGELLLNYHRELIHEVTAAGQEKQNEVKEKLIYLFLFMQNGKRMW